MSEEPPKYVEVGLMPWACLVETISIGDWGVAPWQEATEHIESDIARGSLSEAICRYRKDRQTAKDSAALILRASGRLDPVTPQERADIRDVINVIAFSHLVDNWGPLARTAENFEYVFLQIPEQILSEGFAYASGSVVRIQVTTSAGVNKVFYAPDYVHVPMASKPDRTMLGLLTQVYESLENLELRARVLRSLDFVRLAYANADSFDEKTRIVLLCTAFETLFRVNRRRKAEPIAQGIDELLGKSLPQFSRVGRDGEHTRFGWFFRDLYDLRNRIMHGDAVGEVNFIFANPTEKQSRFLIGVDLFQHALEEYLYQAGIASINEIRWIRKLGLAQYFDEPSQTE